MPYLLVVDDPQDWPLDVPNLQVTTGRAYLTDPTFAGPEWRGSRIFNCCRTYRYQSTGYYVSLLAEARGGKVLPGVSTIQDLKQKAFVRLQTDDLSELVDRVLKPIKLDTFTLSVYFGRNVAKRYDDLARRLYRLFPAPFLQATFIRASEAAAKKGGSVWMLQGVAPRPLRDIPADHWPIVEEAAAAFFTGKQPRMRAPKSTRYDLAMLVDPTSDPNLAPSNEEALKRFTKAAERAGCFVERITREDIGRLAEFDALFIRETTGVNHYTYRFARRAAAEGLVVIDDPDSILRCCNKVYLAERLRRQKIAHPKTLVLHAGNVADAKSLGTPVILKQPDGSFSQGVRKAHTPEDLRTIAKEMLEASDLIVAQQYTPTDFDWRVGVLDRQPLYACRYHMAANHWQILQKQADGTFDGGMVDSVPIEEVPKVVIRTALDAANMIGDGLYGVDLKQVGERALVIEVNDNPNIDADMEDQVLGAGLWDRLVRVFVDRIERRRNPAPPVVKERSKGSAI